MKKLNNIAPQIVFDYFEALCQIPHGSGNTKAISDYLVQFAKDHRLDYVQDDYHNVIIFKPATKGYENADGIIIQGHMDMVCEQTADCDKNMAEEGLDLCLEGDCISAVGTTLGGDDGIAVAMALAVLAADDLPHPALEAVFTVDEEIGMIGAAALDCGLLKSKKMINIDSEVEGIFTVSCAGGNLTTCTLPITTEKYDGTPILIAVNGLIGGHSGIEIDKGRANANLLISRILTRLSFTEEFRLIRLSGGLKDNAIPVSASAAMVVQDPDRIKDLCAAVNGELRQEYADTDPHITITVETIPYSDPMDARSTEKVIAFLSALPNGIQTMSYDIPGLVRTSLNLGIMTTEEKAFSVSFCVRSSIDSQKQMLTEKLQRITAFFGGTTTVKGDYPGWAYCPDSALRSTMEEVFETQYGKKPKIEAVHAGLECGIFSGKIKNLDCISIGPDITDIHTPKEKLHIASVRRTWELVLETLKRSI